MIHGQLIHPHILSALAKAGHGSKVLISDGNYPHWTKRGVNAEVVYLNLAPGMVSATDVLKVLVGEVPIEAAAIMETLKTGPYAMKQDPPIWNEFRQILHDAGVDTDLDHIERAPLQCQLRCVCQDLRTEVVHRALQHGYFVPAQRLGDLGQAHAQHVGKTLRIARPCPVADRLHSHHRS